jgi:hypothetical protein
MREWGCPITGRVAQGGDPGLGGERFPVPECAKGSAIFNCSHDTEGNPRFDDLAARFFVALRSDRHDNHAVAERPRVLLLPKR